VIQLLRNHESFELPIGRNPSEDLVSFVAACARNYDVIETAGDMPLLYQMQGSGHSWDYRLVLSGFNVVLIMLGQPPVQHIDIAMQRLHAELSARHEKRAKADTATIHRNKDGGD